MRAQTPIRPLLAIVLTMSATPLWADDADDGPGRGVGRISLIHGDVSVRRGDSGDLIAAAVNSPLVVQDRLLTGPTSRAEVQFDWANMIRLSHDAEIRLAELEHKRYIIQVARGTVTFRVLRDHDAEVELSTPNVSVRPVKRGTYRLTVHDDGSSEITVRAGEAEIFTPRGSERLKSGRTMYARGDAADPEFRTAAEIRDDEWDSWNQSRDKDLERSRSYNYVSRDIYGADDLDDHGRWVNVTGYGWVWAPNVAPGWAPYRHGRWSWIDYYGWSWVSYDPWGWAPYHYGRWFHSGPYGWCWWPGSLYTRHYWSPGLVAFFGFGSVRVGVGFGNVGWIPLAPFERYYPWYGRRFYGGFRNNTFVNNNIRIVNNVNITNIYRNSRIDRAVTVVDHDGFWRGRPGSSRGQRDPEFSRASVMQGPLPMTPGRESLRLADRDAPARVAESRESGRFFSRRQPAVVDRVPFDDQRRGIEQITRRAFAGEDTARAAGAAERQLNSPGPNQAGEAPDRRNGWRQVGEGIRAPNIDRSVQRGPERGPDRTDEGNWRRFGSPRISGEAATETNRMDRGWRSIGESPARRATEAGEGNRGPDRAIDRATERRAVERSTEGTSDWRRFGGRGDDATAPRATPQATPRADRNFEPNQNLQPGNDDWRRNMAPRTDGSRRIEGQDRPRPERRSDFGGTGGGDAVRISPPIVRERNADRGADRSFGAPQMSPRSDGAGAGWRGGGPRGDGGDRGSGNAGVSRGGGSGRAEGGGSRGGRGR